MVAPTVSELLGRAGSAVHVIERTADGAPGKVLAQLAALAPWLSIATARGADARCPRVRVEGVRPHGEITFLGPVEGRQLEPFVWLLHELSSGEPSYETPATAALLSELERNLALTLAVSATCPYCPALASTVLRFAQASPRIDVVIARADLGCLTGPVRSVPTLLADGVAVTKGPVGEYALAQKLLAAGV